MGLLRIHQKKISQGILPFLEDIHTPTMIEFDWNADGVRTGFPNKCGKACPCWEDLEDAAITRDTGIAWAQFDSKNESMSIKELYDGSDNTLLLAENIDAGITGMWSNPAVVNCGFVYPVDYPSAIGANFANPPSPAEFRGIPNSAKFGDEGTPTPSASHPSIVNFAFASGAVKSISDSIDQSVYARIITPRGSVPHGRPWLIDQPLVNQEF